MNINPLYLKTFIALIENRSFTKTAQMLHMTQPGVSQHIKLLENYFATPLIERFNKSFEMTPSGEKVYHYALSVFHDHRNFIDSLAEDHPHTGFCRMAAPGSFGINMYTHLLRLNKKHKDLSLSFYYAPNLTIEKEIVEDKLDLGFMSITPTHPSLEFHPLEEEKILLVVPFHFNGKHFHELDALGLISHPDAPQMVSEIFNLNFNTSFSHFEKLKISGAINQIHRILEPVSLGLGFTVIPEFAYNAFDQKSKVKIFSLKKQVRNTIYWVAKKHKKRAARLDFIIQSYRKSK